MIECSRVRDGHVFRVGYFADLGVREVCRWCIFPRREDDGYGYQYYIDTRNGCEMGRDGRLGVMKDSVGDLLCSGKKRFVVMLPGVWIVLS